MTAEGRSEGARELVLAVFRLAVADYLGHSYSHDSDAPVRTVANRFRSDASIFMKSGWAAYLGDLGGFAACAVWREVRRIDESAQSGRRKENATRTVSAIGGGW
jgi:hypothetical protein